MRRTLGNLLGLAAAATQLGARGAADGFQPSPFVEPVIDGVPAIERRHPPEFPLTRERAGVFRYRDARFIARIGPDGRVAFGDTQLEFLGIASEPFVAGDLAVKPGDEWSLFRAPALSFRFDVTDLLMSPVGQDPYIYENRNVLDHTFAFRARRAAAHQRRMEEAALSMLPRRLARIWEDPKLTPHDRRRRLDALLEEADGDTAAAARARWMIRRSIKLRPGLLKAGAAAARAATAVGTGR